MKIGTRLPTFCHLVQGGPVIMTHCVVAAVAVARAAVTGFHSHLYVTGFHSYAFCSEISSSPSCSRQTTSSALPTLSCTSSSSSSSCWICSWRSSTTLTRKSRLRCHGRSMSLRWSTFSRRCGSHVLLLYWRYAYCPCCAVGLVFISIRPTIVFSFGGLLPPKKQRCLQSVHYGKWWRF